MSITAKIIEVKSTKKLVQKISIKNKRQTFSVTHTNTVIFISHI